MPTLEHAIILAAAAHRRMADEQGQPYIFRSIRVMLRLHTDVERIVGVLYDLVENTDFTLDRLRSKGYSEEILQALDCLTRKEEASYEQFIERVKANPIARRVKIADLEDKVNLLWLAQFTEENMERMKEYQNVLLQLRI